MNETGRPDLDGMTATELLARARARFVSSAQPRPRPPHPHLDEVSRLLDEDALRTVLQPVVDLRTATVVGYEALTRGPADSTLHDPGPLFDAAAGTSLAPRLEAVALEGALRRLEELAPGQILFVNLDPLVAADARLTDTVERVSHHLGVSTRRIVVEVSERRGGAVPGIVEAMLRHRRNGYRIALDDAAGGEVSERRVRVLSPDYVKLDRPLLEAAATDGQAQVVTARLIAAAGFAESLVIAEGIETAAELEMARRLGVDLAQGFLLGRPSEYPEPLDGSVLEMLVAPARR